jgi:hypothetical protein
MHQDDQGVRREPEPCGESYLQASPDIRYIRVLESDPRGEALRHDGAQLVCERQVAPQPLPIQPAQLQRDRDWRARYREIQAGNLSGEQIIPTRRFSRGRLVYAGTRTSMSATGSCR